MPFCVRVPASTSNLGAGFDCLGLALDLWLEARLVEGDGPARYAGTLAALDPRNDLIARLFHAEAPAGRWQLDIRSDIPVGKGLGSSGAAVVAGLALASLARDGTLDHNRLLQRAAAVEGHPDNVGPAIFGGLFIAGAAGRQTLSRDVGVAFAVPEAGIDTHAARALLPRDVPRDVAVGQANRAAALLLGLTRGDGELIAYGMEDLLAVPHRKALISGFDGAVAAGREAGAYGVTISGAGSALLAVCPLNAKTRVAAAMADALTRGGNPATAMTPGVATAGLTAA